LDTLKLKTSKCAFSAVIVVPETVITIIKHRCRTPSEENGQLE
jgi:hypothetical protein